MRCIKSLILTSTLVSTLTFIARAEINVLASVKPLHSLVAGVMEGVKKPDLIVKGAGLSSYLLIKTLSGKTIRRSGSRFLDRSRIRVLSGKTTGGNRQKSHRGRTYRFERTKKIRNA